MNESRTNESYLRTLYACPILGIAHCHSIVGQKLLCVDWIKMHGLEMTCLRCKRGTLRNDRTNFSKNKMLFPTFMLEGPPQWAMAQSMVCSCCKWRVSSNNGELLCTLPPHARQAYPVETKCAVNKNSHMGRSAADVMDLLMPTHGNGDLCSRLFFNAMNKHRISALPTDHTKKGGTNSLC